MTLRVYSTLVVAAEQTQKWPFVNRSLPSTTLGYHYVHTVHRILALYEAESHAADTDKIMFFTAYRFGR